MITVIIPTRNRPDDLVKAIISVINQIQQPDELIIIDQSSSPESRLIVESILKNHNVIRLKYVHDASIPGLVAAKKVGISKAEGDLICFLEDDVVLEKEYLDEIKKGFDSNAKMMGCCGVVTNPPRRSVLYNVLFKLFRRGIFVDPRVDVFSDVGANNQQLVLSNVLSGGLSAWKLDVFKVVQFDDANGFFMLEDMEFSTRVARHFSSFLYINPNAKLAHNASSVNRDTMWLRQRRKTIEYIAYYKKRKKWKGAHINILWLLVGLMGESICHAVLSRSIKPFVSFVLGIKDGLLKKIIGNDADSARTSNG